MDDTDPLRHACRGLQSHQDPQIQTLARALENLNEWMDASYDDRQRLYSETQDLRARVERAEERLDKIERRDVGRFGP